MPNSERKIFYGWVLVVSFLVISTIVYGLNQSFGVFFKLLGADFRLTRAETSAIVSTQNIFGTIVAFTTGWALDKFGPRIIVLIIGVCSGLALVLTSQTGVPWQLFITYSLFFSVLGANFTTMAGTISRWFHRKRGLALGIAASGVGLGGVAIAPLSAWLISIFHWRTAYIILGAMAWIIIIPLSRTALMSGGVMTWARALGEFGATIIFAGNLAGRTQTMPLAIYIGFELDLEVALTLSVILVGFSFIALMIVRGAFQREWI